MNFLPIIAREARMASRRRMTYYSRSLAGLVAAAAGIALTVAGFGRIISTASAGAGVFQGLAIGGYIFAATQAMVLTCDSISQERREGTLGLLFLTDLEGYDVVFGKLASNICVPLYCLIAALPALGFSLLLGGVTMGNLWQTTLALLNTLFFFASLGLLVSATSSTTGQSTGRGTVALAVFGILLPVCGLWTSSVSLGTFLFDITPAGAVLSALGAPFSAMAHFVFVPSLLVTHAVGWVFLISTSVLLPRSLREKPSKVVASKSNASAHLPRAGGRRRAFLGGARAQPGVILGTVLQQGNPWRIVQSLVVITAIVFLGANALRVPGPTQVGIMAALVLTLHFILEVLTASQACSALSGKRQNGELELILTTPFDEDDLLTGCLVALKRQLLWPALYILALDGFLLIAGWRQLGLMPGIGWAVALCFDVAWTFLNLYCLAWVGLLLGLEGRNQIKAMGRAFFYVIVLPGLALVVLLAVNAIDFLRPANGEMTMFLIAALALIAAAVCKLGFLGWAMSELSDRFRYLASRNS